MLRWKNDCFQPERSDKMIKVRKKDLDRIGNQWIT